MPGLAQHGTGPQGEDRARTQGNAPHCAGARARLGASRAAWPGSSGSRARRRGGSSLARNGGVPPPAAVGLSPELLVHSSAPVWRHPSAAGAGDASSLALTWVGLGVPLAVAGAAHGLPLDAPLRAGVILSVLAPPVGSARSHRGDPGPPAPSGSADVHRSDLGCTPQHALTGSRLRHIRFDRHGSPCHAPRADHRPGVSDRAGREALAAAGSAPPSRQPGGRGCCSPGPHGGRPGDDKRDPRSFGRAASTRS